ncbi:C40 family peptidase [Nonomuraea salmonea]|uniref:C40 family peptidase n=1 Tax=Nonomuraea salmonea TaxID=46181 RepID=A0ABV5P4K4_9ACTN
MINRRMLRAAMLTTLATAGTIAVNAPAAYAAQAQAVRAATAVRWANGQVGDPYRWGGAGPHSFDCSGLTMYVWRRAGVKLPHNAAGQYRAVRTKVSWRNLKPGDLMLLYGYGHVGIYVGGGRWVHAPGKGRPVRKESIHGWVRSKFNGAVRPGM